MQTPAQVLLENGVRGLRDGLHETGELYDVVFQEPTQYGTAYFAYANAVLARLVSGEERRAYLDVAERGVAATVRHLLDLHDERPPVTRYYPAVGSPSVANLRDFMWPPVLRTLRLLKEIGETAEAGLSTLAEQVASIPVPETFNKRGPVNWASVWMLGEWMRVRAGLSPHTQESFDAWLVPFFEGSLDVGRGVYFEPGLPNSYDLFTRVHLLDLLVEGYRGAFFEDLDRLVESGLRRSLALQLSSGSLASAHRSTGHLWVLGAQCAYFFNAARYLRERAPELATAAERAAVRSFDAARGLFRANGELSPVENVFPADHRIGYEVYTADSHYVSLPLGFFATAVLDGFTGDGPVEIDVEPVALVDPAPINRALLHADRWSLHLNFDPQPGYMAPEPRYDALGIADLTLGPGRRLRFGGQVRHVGTATPLTVGLGIWQPDGSLVPLSTMRPSTGPIVRTFGRTMEGKVRVVELIYRITAEILKDELRVIEDVGEYPVSLLVPYLRDYGTGTTTVALDRTGLVLQKAGETVEVRPEGAVRRVVHLPHGYESRHGLVGLVRFDLDATGPVAYRVRRVR